MNGRKMAVNALRDSGNNIFGCWLWYDIRPIVRMDSHCLIIEWRECMYEKRKWNLRPSWLSCSSGFNILMRYSNNWYLLCSPISIICFKLNLKLFVVLQYLSASAYITEVWARFTVFLHCYSELCEGKPSSFGRISKASQSSVRFILNVSLKYYRKIFICRLLNANLSSFLGIHIRKTENSKSCLSHAGKSFSNYKKRLLNIKKCTSIERILFYVEEWSLKAVHTKMLFTFIVISILNANKYVFSYRKGRINTSLLKFLKIAIFWNNYNPVHSDINNFWTYSKNQPLI